jgi:hypothetical protein
MADTTSERSSNADSSSTLADASVSRIRRIASMPLSRGIE